MANLSQNTSYQGTGGTPEIPKSFRTAKPYTPNTAYKNLGQISARGSMFTPSAPAPVGSPEEYQQKQAGIFQYGSLINNGQGTPTQQPFMPPIDPNTGQPLTSEQLRQPMGMPPDYGQFSAPQSITGNGEDFSWGTPAAPAIMNIRGGDAGGGQYVQDTANPDMLVKTKRGDNPVADRAMRAGRLGSLYQIDHIVPLSLGGADTLANRQLLTYDQNDLKTKAQAIPYTLFAHGMLSLAQARTMAMQWKDRDLTDVPQPDAHGLIPIDLAKTVAERWEKPKEPGFKEVMKEIPTSMKEFGSGYLPGWGREMAKGFASEATLGFLPYEEDEYGNDQDLAHYGGLIGRTMGGLASFMGVYGLIGKSVSLARGGGSAAMKLFQASRGAAATEAASAGLISEAAVGAAKEGGVVFKTFNSTPSYLKQTITPRMYKQARDFGVASAVLGQAHQFTQNHLNPAILSGDAYETDQQEMISNIAKDFALGAISGITTPTLKGVAYAAALPMAMSYFADPDNPEDAIINGIIFGAMQAHSTFKVPKSATDSSKGFRLKDKYRIPEGFNDVEAFGGKKYDTGVNKAYEDQAMSFFHNSLAYHAPDIMGGKVKEGQTSPLSVKGATAELDAARLLQLNKAESRALKNILTLLFTGRNASAQTRGKITDAFKALRKDINTKLDNSTPEATEKKPSMFSTLGKNFSKSGREELRSARKSEKEIDDMIKEEFGPGYQKRNKLPGDEKFSEFSDMDLQTAMTEMKRVTIAARQLYKGGLDPILRNRADLDDLFSFGESSLKRGETSLKSRFDEQRDLVRPPVAERVAGFADESFMQDSSLSANVQPSQSGLPNGDVAITGAASNRFNTEKAEYYFSEKAKGNASPNILLVDRPDTAYLWRIRNDIITSKEIAEGRYAIDAAPDKALQAFGVVWKKDPATGKRTGQKELVELGWVASDFRLNKGTHPEHRAFNNHPGVVKGPLKKLTPENHKDTIADAMRRQNIRVLIANIDPTATVETIISKQPYIATNINDGNWAKSAALRDKLGPVSSADGAKPASRDIPTPMAPRNPETDRATPIRETTREVFATGEDVFDASTQTELQGKFVDRFGIKLNEDQATYLFNQKNKITRKEYLKFITDQINGNNANPEMYVLFENFIKVAKENGMMTNEWLSRPLLPTSQKPVVPSQAQKPTENQPAVIKNQQETSKNIPIPIKTPPVENTTVEKPIVETQIDTPQAKEPTVDTTTSVEKPVITIEANAGFTDAIVKAARETKTLPSKKAQKSPDGEPTTQRVQSMLDVGDIRREWQTSPVEKGVEEYKGPKGDLLSAEDPIVQKEATNKVYSWGRVFLDKMMNEQGISVNELIQRQANKIAREQNASIMRQQNGPKVPEVGSASTLKSIDRGLAADKTTPQYHFYKALDYVFTQWFGKNYRENPDALRFLSSISKEGKDFYNTLADEANSSGKEITQKKEEIDRLAVGDFEGAKKIYAERTAENKNNPVYEHGNGELTIEKVDNPEGISAMSPDGGYYDIKDISEMTIRPQHQEADMAKNLTKLENVMANVSSDMPMTAAGAVRDLKRIILGANGVEGLNKSISKYLNKKSPSLDFKTLEAEATAAQPGMDKLQKEYLELAGKLREDPSNIDVELQLEDVIKKMKNQSYATRASTAEVENLKKQVVAITKAIEIAPDENLTQALEIAKERLQKYENLKNQKPKEGESKIKPTAKEEVARIMSGIEKEIKGLLDGSGGPGVHDGKGGVVGNAWNGLKGMFAPMEYNAADYRPKATTTYQSRGVNLGGDTDMAEIARIVTSEASNRAPDRQQFEAQNILNTGINRSLTPGPDYGKPLVDVLQRRAQFQGYAPDGVTLKSGATTTSQYQLLKQGKIDPGMMKRYQNVQSVMNDLKAGKLEDTTNGATFYVHAKDGTLWLGKTLKEAKDAANKHEKNKKLNPTKWGTAAGLPVDIAKL